MLLTTAESAENDQKPRETADVVSVVTNSQEGMGASDPKLDETAESAGGSTQSAEAQPSTSTPPDRPKKEKPIDILKKITPPQPAQRFLQSWNPDVQRVYFGVGDGVTGVVASFDKNVKVGKWTGDEAAVVRSKLLRDLVEPLYHKKPREIDGRQLFDQVRAVVADYVHFEDERVLDLFTLWIIGTYAYSIFSHFGYFFFFSKLPRSGKTRALEVASHLAFDATIPLNGPTASVIRDIASEGKTVILDTLERWKEKAKEAYAALMEFLDAGFRHEGIVSVKEPAGGGKWVRKEFQVYAPYIMAGIHRRSLTETALDRAFVVEMLRKAVAVKKRKYNHARCERECAPLRDDLYLWALTQGASVAALYDSPELEAAVDQIGLHDRATDIWKPIFAMARALGVPGATVQGLCSLAQEMGGDEEAIVTDAQQLAIVQAMRSEVHDGSVIGITKDLVSRLEKRGVVVGGALTTLLKGWGFEQASHRLPNTHGPRRAWHLTDEMLAKVERDLLAGLIPREAMSSSKTPTTVTTPSNQPGLLHNSRPTRVVTPLKMPVTTSHPAVTTAATAGLHTPPVRRGADLSQLSLREPEPIDGPYEELAEEDAA